MKMKFAVLFMLGLLPGWGMSQTFQEVSTQSGMNHYFYHPDLIGGGVAFFDFNNDGWEDVYLTGGYDQDKLYRNMGNGQFQEIGSMAGLGFTESVVTQGVTTGDIDNDGDRDVFVTTDEHDANLLLINDGAGNFVEVGRTVGISDTLWTTSATMGDFNLDGWLDIYAVNYVGQVGYVFDANGSIIGFAHRCFANSLYLNDGTGRFTEVARTYMTDNDGCGLAVAATDYDRDGDPDIYIANDFGQWVVPNAMLENEFPLASFANVSTTATLDAGIYGMGIAIGDYDEDGNLDYYMTNLGRNILYHNQGNGVFLDVTDSMGVANTFVDTAFATGWGTAFLDFDNDTYLDLMVSNGRVPSAGFIPTSYKDPNKLYRNPGTGAFVDISVAAGVNDSTHGRGLACADYDNDGDIDVLIGVADAHATTDNHALLFKNELNNGNGWLKVRLVGTTSNRDGFGAQVSVFAAGRTFIREIDGGSSHMSQNSSIAHFGLGSLGAIDSLSVSWPGGAVQTFDSLGINQLVVVTENDDSLQVISTSLVQESLSKPALALHVFPNPFSDQVHIQYELIRRSNVRLEIFDLQGRLLVRLEEGLFASGYRKLIWDGKNDAGRPLPNGLYMCVLQVDNNRIMQKLYINL